MAGVLIMLFSAEEGPIYRDRSIIENYSTIMNSRFSNCKYQIKHFPQKIPTNIENYYLEIPIDEYEESINYLRFNTSNKYLKQVIKKNKHNLIKIKMNNNSCDFSKKFGIQNCKNYDFYILKKGENDIQKNYSSGILLSEKAHNIIFYSSPVKIWGINEDDFYKTK